VKTDKEQPEHLRSIELFAWVGEDELGSGEIGIKQGHVPAGYIPLVAISRDKMSRLAPHMQIQAMHYGKKIRLCRFVFAEVVDETPSGEG
jgi:hypothetical protein